MRSSFVGAGTREQAKGAGALASAAASAMSGCGQMGLEPVPELASDTGASGLAEAGGVPEGVPPGGDFEPEPEPMPDDWEPEPEPQ